MGINMVSVHQAALSDRKCPKKWLYFGGGVCTEDNSELLGIIVEMMEHGVGFLLLV